MNQSPGNTLWEQAAAAARRRTEEAAPPIEAPPPGFSTRLADRWAELRQNETFRLWCRWSFRAAIAGVIVAGIIALASPPKPRAAPPLIPPRVEVPSLSPP